MRVLFRAPAGARRGFGHLLRCRSLARALGVRPLIAIRGTRQSVDVALRLGCDVVTQPTDRVLTAIAPDVVVVDDPVPAHAASWMKAARGSGALVVGVHDLGIGWLGGDLLVDGSIVPAPAIRRRGGMTGAAFAILDPGLAVVPRPGVRRSGVLVTLGGGPRAHTACAIAAEIGRRAPEVGVRIIGGFVSAGPPKGAWRLLPPNVTWVGASSNLAEELASAAVAVVGGGMSLYEACALGAATVAVPVVPAQRPTVAAFVAAGAALGRPRGPMRPALIAADALQLLGERGLQRRLVRAAQRLVDGQGAVRVADAIRRRVHGGDV